ncbi:MAG: chromosome segregation protein SMC [Traorella sp.]
MFLKRIELQGFKSFADKTIINFDSELVGIVGPNGCGKSNIADALRWALGEQSVKSLRGEKMSDVIFNGTDSRKAVNVAEVTLVLDNSKHVLPVEFEEVEITRRLHRNTQEGEYYINKTPCRLKDVKELIMDTGLGRDSLSIISQGTVSNFVESKPEERRGLFEEAAGVSKYKKRKNESLSKLNRTQDNLSRLEDILYELDRQLNPLKRQAKKANLYLEKKNELQTIEISVLVHEIDQLTKKIKELKDQSFDLESNRAIIETDIGVKEAKLLDLRKEMSQLDLEINQLQDKFMKVMNQIQQLEANKAKITEKRKYAISTATSEEKAKEIKAMLDEVTFEYQDRLKRLNDLNVELKLKQEQELSYSNELNKKKDSYMNQNSYLSKLKNRKSVLENLLASPFTHQQGVQAIMNQKDSFMGILGVVSFVLKPNDGYEQAIQSAISGAMYHIVCEDEISARHAITYLKKNECGKATFLPLSVCKERNILKEHQIICENMNGYLGVASEFCQCESTYQILNSYLLGNILVCDSLANANELAKALKYRYKIVTMDGETVNRDGSMSGGKTKYNSSPLTLKKELQEINHKIDLQNKTVQELEASISALQSKKDILSNTIFQMQIDIAKLSAIVDSKKAKMDSFKIEYEQYHPNKEFEDIPHEDSLLSELSNAHRMRDEIESSMKVKRKRRAYISDEVQKIEIKNRENRRESSYLAKQEKDVDIDKAKCEANLENALNRLSKDYEMTYEFAQTQIIDQNIEEAKKRVIELRNEITTLGNINLEAPSQYEEVSSRFEFLSKQKEDLVHAKEKILEAIDEMDDIMVKQFKESFDAINAQLNDQFRKLFGGGKASLKLVDPSDILNTGIDIDVQPPGKNIQNLSLLSGGEKSLVAICVLFSILKASTMPLCVFDEVEAALDTANVERFAKYISQFKDGSQFIVVTHRPGTMEQCDALYGVTMKQKGISSLLRVQLNEALDYVDEKGGN